ncbi:MAG: hypothetical protein UV29_C0023G0007 [Candidatus Collierbacteria bacterium GW2011_GWD2_42_50]|nr:MAG: hypothetical protein UV29_C0023G0007 [Candidatus Collierbacteria bacterium GW2011_GWD2_42_50]
MVKILKKNRSVWLFVVGGTVLLIALGFIFYVMFQKQLETQKRNVDLEQQIVKNNETILNIQAEIERLNNERQIRRLRNRWLI